MNRLEPYGTLFAEPVGGNRMYEENVPVTMPNSLRFLAQSELSGQHSGLGDDRRARIIRAEPENSARLFDAEDLRDVHLGLAQRAILRAAFVGLTNREFCWAFGCHGVVLSSNPPSRGDGFSSLVSEPDLGG